MQNHDSNTGASAPTENTLPRSPENEAAAWSSDLFKPELTTEQIVQAQDKFQADAMNLRTAMLVLTRTPVELLELGQKDIESFEQMFQMVSHAVEYTELSLEMAKSAEARLMLTAGKLLGEMDAAGVKS